VFMFIAGIRLRYTHPLVSRSYKIPHKHKGMWLVASIGLIASVFAFFISFIPPAQLEIGSLVLYESFLIGSLAFMIAIPLVIYSRRKPHWMPTIVPSDE
ncbi:MAG: amino acid permease, partial [Simkaniaceae bacterium]|nr:amino acid permease [Simkaniaceae bacterium]